MNKINKMTDEEKLMFLPGMLQDLEERIKELERCERWSTGWILDHNAGPDIEDEDEEEEYNACDRCPHNEFNRKSVFPGQ